MQITSDLQRVFLPGGLTTIAMLECFLHNNYADNFFFCIRKRKKKKNSVLERGEIVMYLRKYGKSANLCLASTVIFTFLQLNKYETAPNFIQLSQNLTSDCLLI